MNKYKPRYFNGTRWVHEVKVILHSGLKVSEFAQFVEANNIPQDAEFDVVTEYLEDGPQTVLRWYTPVSETEVVDQQ